jgi:hypothetical protein
MADQSSAKPAFVGLDLAADLRDFETDAPAPAPRRPDTASLNAVSERAGFPSREPRPAKRAPPPVRAAQFDTRLTLRLTEEDKRRFDDLVYRLRVPNGEAFRRLLDQFEGLERKR